MIYEREVIYDARKTLSSMGVSILALDKMEDTFARGEVSQPFLPAYARWLGTMYGAKSIEDGLGKGTIGVLSAIGLCCWDRYSIRTAKMIIEGIGKSFPRRIRWAISNEDPNNAFRTLMEPIEVVMGGLRSKGIALELKDCFSSTEMRDWVGDGSCLEGLVVTAHGCNGGGTLWGEGELGGWSLGKMVKRVDRGGFRQLAVVACKGGDVARVAAGEKTSKNERWESLGPKDIFSVVRARVHGEGVIEWKFYRETIESEVEVPIGRY